MTAYEARTERLLLRCWSPADADAMREALDASDGHLRPWIPFMRDEPRSLAETVEWLRAHRASFDRDEDHRYGAFDGEGRLVGGGMLSQRPGPNGREIGYWVDVRQTGRGYGTEMAAALTRLAFEVHDCDFVELRCAPENAASATMAAKLGYTHEATLARRLRGLGGVRQDSMIWVLFAEDYGASPARAFDLRALDASGRVLLPSGAG